MELIESIRVYGDPKGQPRPRACIRGSHAGVYDPGTADAWKAKICSELWGARSPVTGPIRVDIVFLFSRPARLCRKKDHPGRIRHISKPDRDNLDKAVLDALTDVGIWGDDCQVCSGLIDKYYVAVEEKPGAEIKIYRLDS